MTPDPKATHRRVLIGSLSGSAIEWYDFLLYASVAPIIFSKQFFPNDDLFVALMLAWLGNLLTFVVRPFGGIVFAHIGDRVGRKKTLVMTLSIMGLGTVAIGLLPTYATIGVAAPLLLYFFRIVQGLAIGGEWGGALLLAYEYAPARRKGLFGAIPQMGVTLGLLLGNAAILLATTLPGQAFETWGWRIPFVFSFVLVVIGLWIRDGLGETPAFREVKEGGTVEKLPLATTLREHWRSVLVAVGAKAVETAPFYIVVTFIGSYAMKIGYDKQDALNAVLLGALVSCFCIPAFGALSDRVGRTRTYLVGVALLTAMAFPYFLLVNTRSMPAFYLASALMLGVAWAPVTATLGTLMSETFSAKVRYTGITLGYQIGAAVFSGTAPLLAEWLFKASGSWWPIAAYIVALGVISAISVSFAPRLAVVEDRPTDEEMSTVGGRR
ncbi:Predicted arabinose efflux permease, MFS family [Austwickia chelonae]|uniref:Putative major facilitator superfamily transporter n=1 Tax=Austwickia chelonae NBRC 105200 TaxID=1184607 RepID=K6VUM3_9MICO|nr:MFS transporter [Austwickia chelonae]GAB79005.1 putative major facilitator superfamily transporter [Austwickia chelonae NBRC 105200]SEW41600.1 Predicted arabinose efflux permease, MFS family [Austwickia chelonae]